MTPRRFIKPAELAYNIMFRYKREFLYVAFNVMVNREELIGTLGYLTL